MLVAHTRGPSPLSVIATSCCQVKILLILYAEDLFFANQNLMAHFDQRSRSPFYASAMGARGRRLPEWILTRPHEMGDGALHNGHGHVIMNIRQKFG
jgi:hypothetical protein